MVTLGLINPKDAANMGSVLRALGCYGADAVVYTGNRYDYAARHHTDTKNLREQVNIRKVSGMQEALAQLPEGTKLVCVELVVGAVPLPEYQHPQDALYVFGPEDASIPADVVRQADDVVYIPTVGCMNLAATVNVLLYDRLAKLGPAAGIQAGDALIKASRDNRNRLRR